MQTAFAFSFRLWNAPVMPRPKVALSGLLAFGAGVAVGASWPRAGNIVGYLLQRLGFELTDLTLWIWDPEKSVVQAPEPRRLPSRKVRRRIQRPNLQQGDPGPAKRRRRAKERPQSPPIHLGTSIDGTPRAARSERGLVHPLLDQSAKNGTRVSRTKRSAPSSTPLQADHRAVRRDRGKTKSTAVNGRRKSRTSGREGKGTFSRTVSPAKAALN
jgi:hypothetical protein